jgi:hypothetical protein
VQTVVFDVSSHLGQMAPVVQTLIVYPEIRVVIRSADPDHVVHDFKGSPVELDRPSPGAMLIWRDEITIDTAASTAAWELHLRWDEQLDRETARPAALSSDVFVADVPCLSLAAAERLEIPSLALC